MTRAERPAPRPELASPSTRPAPPPWGTPEPLRTAEPAASDSPWIAHAPVRDPRGSWNWLAQEGSRSDTEASTRELGIAYALLITFGMFGAHKFYLRNFDHGSTYVVLCIFGWGLSGLLVGFVLLLPLGAMLLADLITLPRQVRRAKFGG